MKRINGIDLEVLNKTKEQMSRDPETAHKTNVIEGVWDAEKTRFTARIEWNNSVHTLEADIPPFLGGTGEKLGALHYCLFGSAACYVGTLVSVAAEQGIDLGAVRLRIENDVNFRPVLGIADEATVRQVRITVEVPASVDSSVLARLKEQADRQCPGMYCLTQPIPVVTQVVTAK